MDGGPAITQAVRMSRALARIGTAVRRGGARADSLAAAAGLFFAGWSAADEQWPRVIGLGLLGLVFLIASGDYSWRKGFVAARREP